MPTSTKQTSLQRLTAALTEHGWQFTTEETTIKVPDKENPHPRSRWSSRNTYPNKVIPAVTVKASNGAKSDPKHFSATFTAEGAYLSEKTTGSYPFSYYTTLKAVLPNIEENSVATLKARAEAEEAKKAAALAEEEREVAETYAAAKEEERYASAAVAKEFQSLGLTKAQQDGVIAALGEDGVLTKYLVTLSASERAGKGWGIPGKTFLRGTYVDGKRVG